MKTFPLRIVASFLGLAAACSAQDLGPHGGTEVAEVVSPDLLPSARRASSTAGVGFPLVIEQGLPLLVSTAAAGSDDILNEPSRFRALVRGGRAEDILDEARRVAPELEKVSAAYRAPGSPESDCQRVGLSVARQVADDPGRLLDIVRVEMETNGGCACEIVKSAILACDAETAKVVGIVETAMLTAPEKLRIISQCAIAAAPESLSAIQSLLARYDANAGGDEAESAKGSKDSKSLIEPESETVAAVYNPLDFPGDGPVGPPDGQPGGEPLIPVFPPIVTPPVTLVDP